VHCFWIKCWSPHQLGCRVGEVFCFRCQNQSDSCYFSSASADRPSCFHAQPLLVLLDWFKGVVLHEDSTATDTLNFSCVSIKITYTPMICLAGRSHVKHISQCVTVWGECFYKDDILGNIRPWVLFLCLSLRAIGS